MAEAPDREQLAWKRLRLDRAQPEALCMTLRPIPFWAMVAAIVVFIPIALLAAFFMKRQVVLVEGSSLRVVELSFWRYQPREDVITGTLGEVEAALDGKVLVIEGIRLHLEPGWLPSAERIVELNEAAGAG